MRGWATVASMGDCIVLETQSCCAHYRHSHVCLHVMRPQQAQCWALDPTAPACEMSLVQSTPCITMMQVQRWLWRLAKPPNTSRTSPRRQARQPYNQPRGCLASACRTSLECYDRLQPRLHLRPIQGAPGGQPQRGLSVMRSALWCKVSRGTVCDGSRLRPWFPT